MDILTLTRAKKFAQDLVKQRVDSLTDTPLVSGMVIEAVGVPEYVADVSQYSAYSLTDTGWYVFARVTPKAGTIISSPTVTGASGYVIGSGYVDVAVRFDVAAQSVPVTVNWGAYTDTFVFKATDLAIRNLDYRTTFYVYDISPYAIWTYALTTDPAFVSGSHYYTEQDSEYTEAVEGTDWTAGDAVPAYYTEDGGAYTQVVGFFLDGVTYYTKSGDTYTEAAVTVGGAIPAYYKHSKITFSGMVPNVTYKLDNIVDCPIEITLPDVADDGHGAWFEVQMRYNGSYSCTLLPPEGVKIGTAQTQAQSAGINTIDLQYTVAGAVKMWTLLNTHSNIPA